VSSESHPGTPRLFSERFAHPSGARTISRGALSARRRAPDDEYPLYFTTGRYKEHYNSGAQTRRVAKLVDAKPEPRLQMHPELGARLGVGEGHPVVVESRRGKVRFAVNLTADIRRDTLFAPFSLGRAEGGKPSDDCGAGPLEPYARVQGLRGEGSRRRRRGC